MEMEIYIWAGVPLPHRITTKAGSRFLSWPPSFFSWRKVRESSDNTFLPDFDLLQSRHGIGQPTPLPGLVATILVSSQNLVSEKTRFNLSWGESG